MPRQLWLGLPIALLSCGGCFTTEHETLLAPAPPVLALKAPPPVTADQVNDQNAHQIAQALWEEIDRETRQAMVSPPSR